MYIAVITGKAILPPDKNLQIMTKAICKSREDNSILRIIDTHDLKRSMRKRIENGEVWGIYYAFGEVVAEDIWGDIHTNIFKPQYEPAI